MTRGTITNKQTGLEITGDITGYHPGDYAFHISIDGASTWNTMEAADWDYTPEPEPIKDGVYVPRNSNPGGGVIYKYRGGQWRDAHGYELNDQMVDVSGLVRLVPEA